MIFDSLKIAASSLQAQQKAMNVVSNNISNANTPGYSKQTATLATMTPDTIAGLSFGRGVNVASVTRIVDPVINNALLDNGAQKGYWTTVNTGLNSVQNVFGSLQSTGLSAALNDFFLSWQQLANNPLDNGQKFNVLAKSDTLATNLINMNSQLTTAQTSANTQIDSQIQQANLYIDTIALQTTQISQLESGQQGAVGAANDLRDQRDQTVRNLSALIPVKQVATQDGGLLLQTASGDLLAQDGVANHIARGTAAANGFGGLVIARTGQPIKDPGQGGGSIGGLIQLRDNNLGSYLQQINSIAANLAFSVNQIHASASSGIAKAAMTAGQTVNAALALNDPGQVAPFAAQIQTGSFKIHVYDATGAATPAGGTAIPVTAGVTTMNDIVTSLNAVAGVTASIDATGHLNITAAAGSTIAMSSDTSNVLAAYEVNTFFTGATAATIGVAADIKANPASIATGRVDPLTSAISTADNSASIAIMQLQNQAISVDGTTSASLNDRTTNVSTQYGSDVATSLQQLQYRTAESDSLTAQQQAISGVNTDEELVAMIQFQRAYEASAKVITTTNTMLDSLMGLIR